MLVEALLIGIIVGLLQSRLGSKKSIPELRFVYLPLIAFGLEFVCQRLLSSGILFNRPEAWAYTLAVQLAVYGILITFIGLNFSFNGIKIFLIGTIMNLIVIVANLGSMPVDGTVLERFGYLKALERLSDGQIFAHSIINESTRLKFMSDIINITPPYPFPKSISIGDIIMAIGIVVMASALVKGYSNQQEPETM